MNLQVSSDNMEVSKSMKELANQKIAKLERRWTEIPDDNKSVRVVLNSTKDGNFLVKIDANLDGSQLYTEEQGFELETALVDAVDELDRMYLKSKEKREGKDWEKQRKGKVLSEEDLEKMAEDAGFI